MDESNISKAALHAMKADIAGNEGNMDLSFHNHIEASKFYFNAVASVPDALLASSLLLLSNTHARMADIQKRKNQFSPAECTDEDKPPAFSEQSSLHGPVTTLNIDDSIMAPGVSPLNPPGISYSKSQDFGHEGESEIGLLDCVDDLKQLEEQLQYLGLGNATKRQKQLAPQATIETSTLQESLLIIGHSTVNEFHKSPAKRLPQQSQRGVTGSLKKPSIYTSYFQGTGLESARDQSPELSSLHNDALPKSPENEQQSSNSHKQIDNLLKAIETLHVENSKLIEDVQTMRSRHQSLQTIQEDMARFKEDYRTKFKRLWKKLDEVKKAQHDGSDTKNKIENDYQAQLEKTIRQLVTRLRGEKYQGKKKDEQIKRLQQWCKTAQQTIKRQQLKQQELEEHHRRSKKDQWFDTSDKRQAPAVAISSMTLSHHTKPVAPAISYRQSHGYQGTNTSATTVPPEYEHISEV
mmetsp:Transcript_30554/g.52782  ORF Transcript_30554/g.52782 Transcript_30554/m.52782 type:complete len:465 (+) Transcript_30554:113-1507(+)